MATTPLTDQTTRNDYVATASQTTFPYTFWIKEEDHLDVYVNGVLQTLGGANDYTVSAVQSVTGANVVFNSGLSADDAVAIVYNPDIERATDFTTSGSLRATALNLELTYTLSLLQYLKTESARTLSLSPSDAASVSLSLPSPSANLLLGWNAAGNAITNYSFADLAGSIDTVLTSLSDGDSLQYDASESTWVNTKALVATTIDAGSSAGGNLRTSGGTNCLSWGGGGGANLTLGGNMSGGGSRKLVNMADPTSAQDYATKNYVDNFASGLVLLGSHTASNATSVDIGSGLDLDATIDGTYDEYILLSSNVIPAVDGSLLRIRTSADGGSTFDSGSTDYAYVGINQNASSSTVSAQNSAGISFILFSQAIGNNTGESVSGLIKLHSPAETTDTLIECQSVGIESSAGNLVSSKIVGARNSSAAVDAIRIYFSSGNISSGEFYLYGIKKT